MQETAHLQQDASRLKKKVVRSLKDQGFKIKRGMVVLPSDITKEKMRDLHKTAVEHKQERAKESLFRKEGMLLEYIASGDEVEPTAITPRLIEVLPGSCEELLFRYAALHWSIPISSGYGRRLRFIVVDEYNGKLMGLIGLGDPVYSLGARDRWIGWTSDSQKAHLRNVMDAFVLGAIPPYSFLLGGKLVALLLASDTVRKAFERKYSGVISRIREKTHDGSLALVTTTSALGKSSVYNRLRIPEGPRYQSVGYTKGFGEFHFTNGLYSAISRFVQEHSQPTEKQAAWGNGFRNRREVVKKCLPAIGLSSNWLQHGVQREVFVVALAKNTRGFLRGKESHLDYYAYSEDDIFDYFRSRWLLPRASRDSGFKSWERNKWLLWPEHGGQCG